MSFSGILKTIGLATVAGVVVANLITSKSSSGSVVARMLGKRDDSKNRVGSDSARQRAEYDQAQLRSPL